MADINASNLALIATAVAGSPASTGVSPVTSAAKALVHIVAASAENRDRSIFSAFLMAQR